MKKLENMTKIKKTYKDLLALQMECTTYLIRNDFFKDGKWTDKPHTKMVTAMKNVLKQAEKHLTEYNEELDNLRVKFCLEDEKTKAVLKDEDGAYKFSKDGIVQLKTAIKEFEKTEIEMHQRLVEGAESEIEDYESFTGIFTA